MEFKKYSSIENSHRSKFINMINYYGLSDEVNKDYVVTEKIHGGNFSLYFDSSDIDNYKPARRTGFLDEGEKFYNWRGVINPIIDNIKNVVKEFIDNEEVVVVGELFGGSYEHPDVKNDSNFSRVQKGVFYHPQQKFYIFDIKVDGKYIDYDKMVEVCEKFDLFYAKELFRGTLDKCLEFPNEFQSTIPTQFGLPQIEHNTCEGVVIKPNITQYVRDKRVIIKNKNEKFSEKKKGSKPKIDAPKLEPEYQNYLDTLISLVCENRLRNVLSHLGEITSKDFGKITKALADDCMEEFSKDNEEFLNVDKQNKKIISKQLNFEITKLVRSCFLNIIDGEF